jgi:hypothetical protein
VYELIELNLSISVLIDLINHLLDQLLVNAQFVFDLRNRDGATTVLVKHLEGLLKSSIG